MTNKNEFAKIYFDDPQSVEIINYNNGIYPVAVDRFSQTVLLNNGTSEGLSNCILHDVIAVCSNLDVVVGLTIEGKTVCVDRYTGESIDSESRYADVLLWTDIVAIDAGDTQIVGLKSDGTVVAAGKDINGQLNVNDWKNIVAVSAGQNFTCGLKKDGTVITTLPEEWRTADGGWYSGLFVNDWNHVIAISAGDWTIAGLKDDGTVLYAVTDYDYNIKSLSEISNWTDIIAVTSGLYEAMALRADGTLLVAGGREFDEFSKLKLW